MDRSRITSWPLAHRVSATEVVVAQVLGVFAGALASLCGVVWWGALALAFVLMLLAVVHIGGWSSLSWVRTAWRYLTTSKDAPFRTVSFAGPTGQSVGLRWDGASVVAVVEVLPPAGSLTQITRDGFQSTHELPTEALAGCLAQHDISLSGIDIVSHGYRAAAGTPATDVYDRLVGPLPATATRMVWVALRFDATGNTEAVARRGGGEQGASRVITIAASRVVRALADAGCRARILTAPEIDSAALQISRGVDPKTVTQTWKHAPLPGVCNTGYGVDPRYLTKDLLAKLWVPSSLGTTVTIRLRPSDNDGQVLIGAGCRITTRTMPEPLALPGLVSMRGRHKDSLLSNLPVAVSDLDDVIPLADVPVDAVGSLQLPPAGCGQLIGSDDYGHGITARIAGPSVGMVYVAGELYLAQQLVFRAVATGARVLIHTDRPEAWSSLIDSIATPDRLRVAGHHPQSDNKFNTVVFDGVAALPPRAGVTALYLYAEPSQWPGAEPDLSIVQPNARGDRILLSTGGTSIELMLVTISSETAFIGRPRGVDDYQPAYQY
ncbi:type VII secretion protein EccE [Rhodococcus tibetensis]|uniref:Type VII secretion protein EccE n=1 Tax=Rhodococcus tibetensis TaxID=2965064 RepID=A0ABT1QGI8_9NOCA|nr:type VII secretion protein EccE [Rhodococcus sp. FXJ9.536]MCQ4120220.1 type VII secretion protein EccE [Rhodococcus sp. FXJ9.536]